MLLSTPKAILVILCRPPYPVIGGEARKNFEMIKALSRKGPVDVLISGPDADQALSAQPLIDLTRRLICFQLSKRQMALNLVRALFTAAPLQCWIYIHPKAQHYCEVHGAMYDRIVLSLVRTAQYGLDRHFSDRCILDLSDSIALNYQRSRQKTHSLFWRMIYLYEWKKLLHFERRCVQAFPLTTLFNASEQSQLHVGDKQPRLIPHGISDRCLQYRDRSAPIESNTLVFFGKMNYQPNVDAVCWFAQQVMPKLGPEWRLKVIGAMPSRQVYALSRRDARISVQGFVEDPYAQMQTALAVIAPMQTGGGIQNKILESLSVGGYNLVSSLAASAFPDAANALMEIIDQPAQWVTRLTQMQQAPEATLQKRSAGRAYARANHTWAQHVDAMLSG